MSDTLCSPLSSIASLVYDSNSDDSTAEGSKQLRFSGERAKRARLPPKWGTKLFIVRANCTPI